MPAGGFSIRTRSFGFTESGAAGPGVVSATATLGVTLLFMLFPTYVPPGPVTVRFRLLTSAGVPAGSRFGASVHASVTSSGEPGWTLTVYERVAPAPAGNAAASARQTSWYQLFAGSFE